MPDDKNIALNNSKNPPEPQEVNIDSQRQDLTGENQAKEEQVINNTEDLSNDEIDLAKELAKETSVQNGGSDLDLADEKSQKDINTKGADVLGQEEVDLTTQKPKVENQSVPTFQEGGLKIDEELPVSAEKSTEEVVLPPKIDESQIQPEKPVGKAIQPQTIPEPTDLEPTVELGKQVPEVPTAEEIPEPSISTPPSTTSAEVEDNRNWFQKLFGIDKEEPHPVSQEAVKTGDTSTMEEIAATPKEEIGQNEEAKK